MFGEKQSKTIVGYLKIQCYKKLNWAQQFLRLWSKSKGFWAAYGFFLSSLKLLEAIDLKRNSHTYDYHSTNKLLSLQNRSRQVSVLWDKVPQPWRFQGLLWRDTLKTWDIMHVTGLTMKSHQQKFHQVTVI